LVCRTLTVPVAGLGLGAAPYAVPAVPEGELPPQPAATTASAASAPTGRIPASGRLSFMSDLLESVIGMVGGMSTDY
jgi:hypothetical protein